jgi:hypothetical protein
MLLATLRKPWVVSWEHRGFTVAYGVAEIPWIIEEAFRWRWRGQEVYSPVYESGGAPDCKHYQIHVVDWVRL